VRATNRGLGTAATTGAKSVIAAGDSGGRQRLEKHASLEARPAKLQLAFGEESIPPRRTLSKPLRRGSVYGLAKSYHTPRSEDAGTQPGAPCIGHPTMSRYVIDAFVAKTTTLDSITLKLGAFRISSKCC